MMRGTRAKKLRRLTASFDANPPEGFIPYLESFAGDFMYLRQEREIHSPSGWKLIDGLIRRQWFTKTDSEGMAQRNLYQWIKRLWKRGHRKYLTSATCNSPKV